MEDRYSWMNMPSNYRANYYNDADLNEGKTFVVLDKLTGLQYDFPRFEKAYDRSFGRGRMLIDHDLWNSHFFKWCCKTSPDFCNIVPDEFLTPELVDIAIENASSLNFIRKVPNISESQCARFVSRFPQAVCHIPSQYRTEKIASDILEKDPACLVYFKKDVVSSEMALSGYKKVSIRMKMRYVEVGFMNGLLTSEDLEELVDGGVVFQRERKKDRLLNNDFWKNVSESIITDDLAKKIVNKDSDCIRFIPEDKITREMCFKAVSENKDNISYVPLKFQEFEIQKVAIDQDFRAISAIPDDSLNDEIINYAININGLALRGLPEERKTLEVCELAVSKNAKAFIYVPFKYKTYELCIIAVSYAPHLLKHVPVHILTNSFYEELREKNIAIPSSCVGYLKSCLEVNNGVNDLDINLSSKSSGSVAAARENNEDIDNVSLNNLVSFFSPMATRLLEKYKVFTVKELFDLAERPEFVIYFGDSKSFDELNNSVRTLRCKYLNERPLFNINDNSLEMGELYTLLGLSTRARRCLIRNCFASTPKEFFDLMREAEIEDKLLKLRNMGEACANEVIYKVGIILNYYDNIDYSEENMTVSEDNSSDVVTLEVLNQELQRLEAEKKKIDTQIGVVSAMIQEKMAKQSTGGAK